VTAFRVVFNLEQNIADVFMESVLSVFPVEDKVDLDHVAHQPFSRIACVYAINEVPQ